MAGTRKKAERCLYMDYEEANKFIQQAYNIDVIQGMLWDLVFTGGLRISEALLITPSDIDHKTNKIKIHTLKQRKDREQIDEILFPENTIAICKKIIDSYLIGNTDKIFEFTRQHAWNKFKIILKKANLNKLYSPHALRHAHGIQVAEATKGDLVKIARRLRHKNLSNAFRYTHLTDEIQKEVISFLDNKSKKR